MAKGKTKKSMKMRELVRLTGVRKATIHYYISKRILPKPRKTERNMAYYDESYVERIKLIKELQLKYFLPLEVIRQVLSQNDGKLSPAELDAIRFGHRFLMQSEKRRDKYESQTLGELSKRTGLPQEDILEMERCEIISPTTGKRGEKRYEDVDIRIIESFAAIRKAGFTKERGFEVRGFRVQSDLIGMLAIEEVKDLSRELGAESLRDPEYLQNLATNGLESINNYISQLHRKKFLEAFRTFIENGEEALNHRTQQKGTIPKEPRRRKSPKQGATTGKENS
ncbi:MAG: MerR family transcriptional regulator [Candidatus Abyssobacteria bacterium SURF_17]|uniref:MerR family transcriptional regulator n=1 Tax=Candidatus Abyssobacteria bacterium SURF_17 TaxID=2093361 RepID=A0A419ERS6_9BACT|nr:MAG: MerR family transcriptional regulator [Candidatus Abyssubacteria bacterium SURF_17]